MPLTDDELTASAVLEELRSDRSLLDGVIPKLPAAGTQAARTRFALGSCQYPGGFLDEAAAYAQYRELAQRLATAGDKPRFVILTGDQVYTDATAGLLDPSIADGRYRLPYERWLRARAARTALRQCHSFMLLDDHEIENDWEETGAGDAFDGAMAAYSKYQRTGQPLSAPRYFDFSFDGFRFFMLDTRTRREARSLANLDAADMLDGQGPGQAVKQQYSDLAGFVQSAPFDRPKFIVSPSMLLPRHRESARWDAPASALQSDSWDGFPASLHRLLALAQKSSSEHVVFLSGDEHIGCVATITVKNHTTNTEKTMYSIHSPGLYTPYTFANSAVADWLPETSRQFTVGGSTFDYSVTYTPFEGEGFVYVTVEKIGADWHLSCQFADGPVQSVF